jgi:hypothetical protein
MNASKSESASGVNGNGNGNGNASANTPEWTVIGSANDNDNDNGSEGNKNGRSVYGGGRTRAHVRIHDLFARYRSDRNHGRPSDGYRGGNLGVAACRLRHARPSFPSENGEINRARCVEP